MICASREAVSAGFPRSRSVCEEVEMKSVKRLLAASGLVLAAAGLGLLGCTSKDTDASDTRTSRTSATTIADSSESAETTETAGESGVTEDTTGATSNMTNTDPKTSGKKEIKWTLSSFDGGGPRYEFTFEDSSIVKIEYGKKYRDPDHDRMNGAGFTYTYIFTGIKPGTTKMTVEETLQEGNCLEDRKYYIVTVYDDLTIDIVVDEDAIDPDKMPVLSIGDREFKVVMENNDTSQEIMKRQNTAFSLGTMKDVGGNEKSCWIAEKIYKEEITTVEVKPGDIIRYGKLEFAIVYKAHTIDCVVIGHLQDVTEEELTNLLAVENVEKEFYVPHQ